MTDKALIGQIVAQAAESYAVPTLIASDALPDIQDRLAAEAAIDRVVKQSAPLHSERVWAGVFGILGLVLGGIAAALMVPEAKEAFGPAAPIWAAMLGSVASGLAGVAALVSKANDPRPTR
jgi:hypothetical protein